MKKLSLILSAILCLSSIFAGGIDNKSNLNAGYLRNPSRNVETKRPDAVLYNISGTSFMEDGLYIDVGNQFVLKKYTNEFKQNNTKYEDNEPVFFFPNAEIVYKKDNWAAFFGFGVFAGGGTSKYKDGNGGIAATFLQTAQKYQTAGSLAQAQAFQKAANNHELEVYSVTMGETFGGSYNITENLSVALAGRFLHGKQTMNMSAPSISQTDLGFKAFGCGFGGILGATYSPVENLLLSIQYQTITKLNFKFDSIDGSLTETLLSAKEGDKFKNDLPAVLSLGAGYNVLDNLFVSTSFNYYFNKQAKIENPMGGTRVEYNDSWELGLGADYQYTDKLCLSGGAMYSKQGYKDDVNSTFCPALNSLVLGCGAEYKATKQVALSAGYMYCKYFEAKYKDDNFKLNKQNNLLAFSVTFKPF